MAAVTNSNNNKNSDNKINNNNHKIELLYKHKNTHLQQNFTKKRLSSLREISAATIMYELKTIKSRRHSYPSF